MAEVQCTVDEISLSYIERINSIHSEFSTVVEGHSVHNIYSGYGDGLLLPGGAMDPMEGRIWYKSRIKIHIPQFNGVSSKLVFSIKINAESIPRNSYAVLSERCLSAQDVGKLEKRTDDFNEHLSGYYHEVPTETLESAKIASSITFSDDSAMYKPPHSQHDGLIYYIFDINSIKPGVYYIYILHNHVRSDQGIPTYVQGVVNSCKLHYDKYYTLKISAKVNNVTNIKEFGNYAKVTVNGIECVTYDKEHKEGFHYRILATSDEGSKQGERYIVKVTEISANLTANSYRQLEFLTRTKLHFDSNGGTKVSKIYKTHGISLQLPSCTKTGYILDGWLKDNKLYAATSSYTEDPLDILGTDNLINEKVFNQYFTAKWSPRPVTVKFIANGGKVSTTSKNIGYECKYSEHLPKVSRTNYTFNGWYLDENLTIPLKQDDIVKRLDTHCLYASWSPNPFMVSYIFRDKYVKSSHTYYDDVNYPYKYIVPGYKFNGWYDGNKKVDKPFKTNKNLELVGDYVEVPCIKCYIKDNWKVVIPHVYKNGKWVAIDCVFNTENATINFNKYDWLDATYDSN